MTKEEFYHHLWQQSLHRMAGCGTVLIAASILISLLTLGSCKSIQYVPVEKVRTDTLYQSKILHDSIYVHDSISVSTKGDTVKIEHWHTKYVDRQVHDTVYHAKVDSIPVPYPVEKQLSWWQQAKIDFAGYIIGILLIFILIFAVYLCIKKRLRR